MTALFDGKGEEGGEGRKERERWVRREFIMNEEGSAITWTSIINHEKLLKCHSYSYQLWPSHMLYYKHKWKSLQHPIGSHWHLLMYQHGSKDGTNMPVGRWLTRHFYRGNTMGLDSHLIQRSQQTRWSWHEIGMGVVRKEEMSLEHFWSATCRDYTMPPAFIAQNTYHGFVHFPKMHHYLNY